MNRLIVWRHGETEWNAAKRVQGQADVRLSGAGRAQAAAAAARLAPLRPAGIVASDLRRAAETAEALAKSIGVPVRYDARLRERYFGPWQGCDVAEISAQWPAEFARWRAGEHDIGLGIEPLDALAKRAAAALADAHALVSGEAGAVGDGESAPRGGASEMGDDRLPHDAASVVPRGAVIVVATHGGAARAGCAELLGWPEAAARTLGVLGNCRWTELQHHPTRGWQLWSHNS